MRINLYTWWTVCKEYVWFMMKNLALFDYLSWFIYILIDNDRSNWLRSNKIDLLLTVGHQDMQDHRMLIHLIVLRRESMLGSEIEVLK